MTDFKKYVEGIVKQEMTTALKERGIVLETEFCSMLCEKYNFTRSTVIGAIRRIYPELSLIRRRLSDELKFFFKLEVKGCPVIYVADTCSCNG